MTKVELVAEMGNLQCWRLAEPLRCFYVDLAELHFCRSPADFIIQYRDGTYVMPLCRQHLPEWAKQALKDDTSEEGERG
jgi:hypothetical protein